MFIQLEILYERLYLTGTNVPQKMLPTLAAASENGMQGKWYFDHFVAIWYEYWYMVWAMISTCLVRVNSFQDASNKLQFINKPLNF